MYNVVFYDKIKEVSSPEEVIERHYNDDGTYTDTITTKEITRKYRVPTKFIFETATSCDKFLQGFTILDSFQADMPSLNSAVSMFEGSSITSLTGSTTGTANFQSLTSANRMFKNCAELVSINIDAPSLVSVEELCDGCSSLQSISGSFKSLADGTSLFANFASLTTFDADLNGLENGTQMFKNSPLTSFTTSLQSLKIATEMFANTNISAFSLNSPNLIFADSMFENCTELTSVTIDAPLMKSGNYMFKNTSITSCEINCPALKYAEEMFGGVSLTTFTGNLSSLVIGDSMFGPNDDNFGATLEVFNINNLENLESANNMMGAIQFENWSIDMPSLISAANMFSSYAISDEETIYPLLTTFSSDLESLSDGSAMFKDCINLTSFNAALPSLSNGRDMFTNCKLDAASVMYIAETLPYYSENEIKDITIGVNCASSNIDNFISSTNVYSNIKDFEKRLYDKGWNVTLVYNPA
jgi:hypothetical protein